MKKVIAIVVVLLVIGCVVLFGFSSVVGKGIAAGVEAFGPEVTQTDVTLKKVDFSLLSGSASLGGLVVGNPEGYQMPSSIELGSIDLDLDPWSALSDKVVIQQIVIDGPEITYEMGSGKSNIGQILANIESFTGPAAEEEEESASGKAFQIDLFRITNGKITVLIPAVQEEPIIVDLPDIELKEIGQGENGATLQEVLRVAINSINQETIASVAASGISVSSQLKSFGEKAKEKVGGLLQGIRGAIQGEEEKQPE